MITEEYYTNLYASKIKIPNTVADATDVPVVTTNGRRFVH